MVIGTIISQSKQVVIGTIISQSKQVIFGMNGVKIKRHGLILWENDATGLKIILEWFPGQYNPFKNSKKYKKTNNKKKGEKNDFLYILLLTPDLPLWRPVC